MNNEPIKLEFERELRPPRMPAHSWLFRTSKYKAVVDLLVSTAANGDSITIVPGVDWAKLSGTIRMHLKRAGYRMVTQRRPDGKISAWTEAITKNGDEHNG